MKEFFDRRSSGLNTSLPSFRLLQELIRSGSVVSLITSTGQSYEGQLKWQDDNFFALQQGGGSELVLISRFSVAVIRTLG
ncbi:MAG: Hfq-related RNA-binding protein [Synechococcaceae cyanobacterium]|jgi:hypothetical protein